MTSTMKSSGGCGARRKPEAISQGPCLLSSSDIPDETEARLVILGPEYPHTAKDDNSAARKEAANILECRGTSPRNYQERSGLPCRRCDPAQGTSTSRQPVPRLGFDLGRT